MPALKLQTNQSLSDEQKDGLLDQLTSLVVGILDKPIQYVQVIVEDNCRMAFGGTSQPCGLVELRSLGMPWGKPRELSESISRLLEKKAGIPPERLFINFFDMDRAMWGWNGSTFA